MSGLAMLTRLKDELVDLHGEDQVAVFVSTTARRQVNDRLKGGTAGINNGLSFEQDDANESTAVADYSVTFAELLARFDPGGERR